MDAETERDLWYDNFQTACKRIAELEAEHARLTELSASIGKYGQLTYATMAALEAERDKLKAALEKAAKYGCTIFLSGDCLYEGSERTDDCPACIARHALT